MTTRTLSAHTVEDVDWLLQQQVPPLYIPGHIGKSADAIFTAARRQGRNDIAAKFGAIAKEDRYWKRRGGHRPIGGTAA